MTITEFLEARIAEDEAEAEKGGYHNASGGVFARDNYGCLLVQPSRVLAECAAKRAIIGLHAEFGRSPGPEASAAWSALGGALQDIAAVYSDHPDYDKDWAL